MKLSKSDFGTGWCELSLGISREEVTVLIERLLKLERSEFDHFAIVNSDDNDKSGIENIEVYIYEGEGNMVILGGDVSNS